jgi:hypothetical protein
MKLTDIVFKSYKDVKEMDQFDLTSMPKKPKWYLQVVAWVLSFPETFIVRSKIKKVNMKSLKGPYLLLCNHNSFLDFKVATRAIFPRRSNYIVAVDGFIGRETLMRNVGCFMKRKFVSDLTLAKQVKHVLYKNRVICQIYPEARYSLVGTSSPLPDSLGKLIKWLDVPVVTLVSYGHHLRQPFWNLKKRRVKTTSVMTQLLSKEDIKRLDVDAINMAIKNAFKYDDYQYQRDHHIKIKESFRAEGLHKALYQCPHCLKEHQMTSKDNQLMCEACGETYVMDEYGQLSNTKHPSKFTHVPDWFEWQRSRVKKEIDQGLYNVELEVWVDVLPNSTGFYRVGKGRLKHNQNGFVLTHDDFEVKKSVQSNFGVHIEYDYFGRGDGISFSTNEETFYVYPIEQNYPVTKFHLAAEELYRKYVK